MSDIVCGRCGATALVRRGSGIVSVFWEEGAREACLALREDPKGIVLLNQCPSMSRALAGASAEDAA